MPVIGFIGDSIGILAGADADDFFAYQGAVNELLKLTECFAVAVDYMENDTDGLAPLLRNMLPKQLEELESKYDELNNHRYRRLEKDDLQTISTKIADAAFRMK
ncbi:MAG: hypothetical protein H6867_06055 [Rhodospirillales bacterium]|nr:hypothetical protein [Rhodospirillales bacterium]MCB9995092.1 hypothetical protein [Rhodospirillales bacterium]